MCRFSENVVRSLLLLRVTKQSRKGILSFSSTSLVRLNVRVLSVKVFMKIVDFFCTAVNVSST